MSDDTVNSAVLPPTSPSDAYASDLARLNHAGPLGPGDDSWIGLAHTLCRFGSLTANEIRVAAPTAADMLAVSAVAAGLSAQSTVLRAARALRNLGDDLLAPESGYDAPTELVVATQAVAEEQEIAGAFGLAFATLRGLLRGVGTRVAPRIQGNVLAQLGRISRQLGANDVAREMYDDAMMVGYESESMDVVARALLGLGVMAITRGNYPTARELFERALVNADRAKDPELIRSAHHGLFNCGFANGDLDSAMVHGWNVLRLCIAPESRAEALINMAEVCRLTGEHEAAMRTYTVAMEWTSQPRVRLHAMSGALQSAIACHRLAEARGYRSELTHLLREMPDTHTRASVGVEVADSLHRLGEMSEAAECLRESMALAAENSLHEVVHRAEQAASLWRVAPIAAAAAAKDHRRKRPYRSEHFRMVLRSLNGLTAPTI